MNRTLKAIIAVIFVLVITFSTISICQHIGRNVKLDVTEQKVYTLSDGSKKILDKLNQPITLKLFYSKTAAIEAPDFIKFYNNYADFVKTLLQEYVRHSNGMVELQIIDPRPYSDEEIEAIRYNLKHYPITEEERFFFGLVLQTEFGVEKTIRMFTPDRQNFVEYDISALIDSAVTREKKKIGVLSSIDVMGDDVSGYMAQMMRMQGQVPKPSWTIISELKEKYDVSTVAADTNNISDIDILLVVHPKNLPDQTLFAIDQFVLNGGRSVICVDPHCLGDETKTNYYAPDNPPTKSSDLEPLLSTWGLVMPSMTFAGDRRLAIVQALRPNERPEPIIGYLLLKDFKGQPYCFNPEHMITGNLNEVQIFFAGVLSEINESNDSNEPAIEKIPLITTTDSGNDWSVKSPYELAMTSPGEFMNYFTEGSEPVAMGYILNGRFKSAFPNGVQVDTEIDNPRYDESDPNSSEKITVQIPLKGLTEAQQDCTVVVFSDVDFIWDQLAYQRSFFGKVPVGDNSTLLINAIDNLSGSSELISIRSRGNIARPFTVVDHIEEQAAEETAEQENRINAEIKGFEAELNELLRTGGDSSEELITSEIQRKKQELQDKIRIAQKRLNDVKLKRRERIEQKGNLLRNLNMLTIPGIILLISIILELRKNFRKRHYISHKSDA